MRDRFLAFAAALSIVALTDKSFLSGTFALSHADEARPIYRPARIVILTECPPP